MYYALDVGIVRMLIGFFEQPRLRLLVFRISFPVRLLAGQQL